MSKTEKSSSELKIHKFNSLDSFEKHKNEVGEDDIAFIKFGDLSWNLGWKGKTKERNNTLCSIPTNWHRIMIGINRTETEYNVATLYQEREVVDLVPKASDGSVNLQFGDGAMVLKLAQNGDVSIATGYDNVNLIGLFYTIK